MKTFPYEGHGLSAAFLGAALVVITVYRVSASLSSMDSTWPWVVGVAFLAVLAGSLPVLFERSTWLSVLALIGAIPVAVFADAIIDETLNQTSRNLFPFEILIWLASACIPVAVGYQIGRMVRSRRQATRSTA